MKKLLFASSFVLALFFANKTFAQSHLPTSVKGCGPNGGGIPVSAFQIECPKCWDFNYSMGPVHSCETLATNPVPGTCPKCIEITFLPATQNYEVLLLSTGQIWVVRDVVIEEGENGTIITLLP